MALLNYTTTVDASKSIAEITNLLVRAGAKSVSLGYAAGRTESVSFTIETPHGLVGFRLPSRVEAVQQTLVAQNRAGKNRVERRHTQPEHAERVAWRIIKDWVAGVRRCLSPARVIRHSEVPINRA